MDRSNTQNALSGHLKELLDRLIALPPFRPGTLTKRFRKCGKKNCRCAKPGHPGHGPCWSLTRAVNGKTKTTVIAQKSVDTVRSQIAAFREFQKITKDLINTNVQLCDAQIKEQNEAPLEKKGSKQKSKKKSTPN
jgi:hypothetical protein